MLLETEGQFLIAFLILCGLFFLLLEFNFEIRIFRLQLFILRGQFDDRLIKHLTFFVTEIEFFDQPRYFFRFGFLFLIRFFQNRRIHFRDASKKHKNAKTLQKIIKKTDTQFWVSETLSFIADRRDLGNVISHDGLVGGWLRGILFHQDRCDEGRRSAASACQ